MNPGRRDIHAFRDSQQREPLRIEVSPFMAGLKMDVTAIDAVQGRLSARFDVDSHYVGGARPTVHGGAIATMLDISMATLAVALGDADKATATANLNISYLRPLPAGRCTCEVTSERVGRTMSFMRAVLLDAQGRTAASASAGFVNFMAE
jgi:uncharacterized protein (TIGR00369 family)